MAWHNVPMPGVYRFTPWQHPVPSTISSLLAIVPPASYDLMVRRYEMTPAPWVGLRT